MLDQFLDLFQIKVDYDFNVMRERQTLAELTSRVMISIDPLLAELRPTWVLVQGDTTTSMVVGLASFYQAIKVGHIEAGLRTKNKRHPFPEEINRRIISLTGDLHFAPTDAAYQSLLAEGIPETNIKLTGNTVIDSLYWMRDTVRANPPTLSKRLTQVIAGRRTILVTGHRRESFGKGIEQICLALREIVQNFSDVCVIYPVHLNPNVSEPVNSLLGNVEQISLISPLTYPEFVWLMDQSYLIMTDSGGVQEEAPSLGKPVLVMRETTERPEGIASGNAFLVGTQKDKIVREACDLLSNTKRYQKMSMANNPYGDGKAATRIVQALLEIG
jgi:UDP-N-acetylglucosamine 2-epimerase (non-hydrolysing)